MVCQDLSMWILRALQMSHPNPWAHINVRVCVGINTHTLTYTPTRVNNREDKRQ